MNKSILRKLTLEGLEIRQCFSIDVGMPEPNFKAPAEILRHNFKMPTDVNQDGITSPLDALTIINELNMGQAKAASGRMSDTNGDGLISPLDALIVINRLNAISAGLVEARAVDAVDSKAADAGVADIKVSKALEESLQDKDVTPQEESESGDTQTDIEDLLNDTITDSQSKQESIATLLRRLQDLGVIDLGSFDLDSFDFDSLDQGSHDTGSVDLDSLDQMMIDLGSLDLGSLDLGSFDLDSFDLGSFMTGSLDVGNLDLDLLGRLDGPASSIGSTYDATDDNGNNFFLSDEEASSLSASIEAALRKELKLDESASIQIGVFANDDVIRSGTWRYLTNEGISIWGNWRQSADELRLFLSNVEEENRIYGQYPDGSFLYFSWLEEEPVGFYFTPLNEDAGKEPVPTERYTEYFKGVGGEVSGVDSKRLTAIFGDLGAFEGVQPIENLISDLYAIQRQWNADLEANA